MVAQTALMSEHGESGPREKLPVSETESKPAAEIDGEEEPGVRVNYMYKQFLEQCKTNPAIVKRLKENPKLVDNLVNVYLYDKLERAFLLRNQGGKGGAYGGPQLMLHQKKSGAKFIADMAAIFGPVALTDDPDWVLDDGIFEVGSRCGICQAPSGTPEALKIIMSRALAIGR